MDIVVLYVTDTMADWEFGYLTAGVALADAEQPGRYRLVVASAADGPIRTKGGVRILPDTTVRQIDPARVAALILPGGDTWADLDRHRDAIDLADELLATEGPTDPTVAAICGATLGLARAGLLDDRVHTSNAPDFLTGPGYQGAATYRDERTVVDGRLVTAPGTAPLEFARAVFARLDLFPAPVLDAWYGLYSTGERRYFDQLTAAGA